MNPRYLTRRRAVVRSRVCCESSTAQSVISRRLPGFLDDAFAAFDRRLDGHRARLEAIQGERAALEGHEVDQETIAGLLADDFQGVWQQLSSRERRIVVKQVLSRAIPEPPDLRRQACSSYDSIRQHSSHC